MLDPEGSSVHSGLLKFGEFELDISLYELRRAGRPVKLEKIPMDLLFLLVEKRGSLVTREEILARLWGDGVFIDAERAINTAIYKIRLALREDPDKPRFIQTVVGKGYRFLGVLPETRNDEASPVAPGSAQAESPMALQARGVLPPSAERVPGPSSLRRWGLAAGGAVALTAVLLLLNAAGLRDRLSSARGARRPAPVPQIESIAVLPLENVSGDPDQEFFADGMTDELITMLAKIRELKVISRTSAMQYKGIRKPLRQIARELNVDGVVEGTVMRSGDRVRVTTQLIHAATDRHLWAEAYDRDVRDAVTLQSDIALAVAHEIQLKIAPQDQTRLARARPMNPQAHEAYLQGRWLWNKRTPRDMQKSLEYFQRAIERDPGYAPAYAGLADAYNMLGVYKVLPPHEAFPKARDAAAKALELDSQLAEGHAAMALVYSHYDWNWNASQNELKRAIELSPGYATARQWYGYGFRILGSYNEAIREGLEAQRLDPLSLIIKTQLAAEYASAGQTDRAIELCHKALELDPNFIPAHLGLAAYYRRKQMDDEAVAEWRKVFQLSGDERLAKNLGRAFSTTGYRGAVKTYLNWLTEKATRDYVPPTAFAHAYAELGENAKAFEWFERAYEVRDDSLILLKSTYSRAPLRTDPRFQELLRRMNLPQ